MTRQGRLRARAIIEKRLRLARREPSAFAEWCLRDTSNNAIRQGEVHRELQQFLGEHSRALIELPRDHGKSTQVCGRIIWELGREPGLRVGVICATESLAMERGRFLREAIESNERVRLTFPKLLPAKPWSDEAFCVARPASVIGPSVVLRGVGSALTGRRLDLLVCDDVVDAKAAASRADREAVKRAFRDDLMNLLEPHGRLWYLCTPWHPRDLSGELKANPAYSLFRRAIGDDLTPVWPEHWPRDRLEARRAEIGPAAFARGYRLVPQSDGESLISPEWVRYYLDEVPLISTVLAVDPAVGTHSRADRTAMALFGLTSSGEVRCLEAIARRWAAPEMARALAEFARRENPGRGVIRGQRRLRGHRRLFARCPGVRISAQDGRAGPRQTRSDRGVRHPCRTGPIPPQGRGQRRPRRGTAGVVRRDGPVPVGRPR